MTRFYKKGIRGGIARVICHYAQAINKYKHDYDKLKKVYSS